MMPLVEIPQIVQHYAPCFQSVFSSQAFEEFQRYLSGLIVSENKTVEGINRIFVLDTRNQSSLNRLLTESPWEVSALNRARLEMLAHLPETRMKPKGVWSIDDTLLTHYGKEFEKIAYLYDSAQECYVWAHNLVNLHYSDDQTDYPVAFRLWEPVDLDALEEGLRKAGIPLRAGKASLKDTAPAKWRQYLVGVWRRHPHKPPVGVLYESKLSIAQQLITQEVQAHPDLRFPVTFDCWYTQPAFCRYLTKTLKLPYVGTLSGEDTILLSQGPMRLDAWDQLLQEEHQQALGRKAPGVFRKRSIEYKGQKETYYSYCKTHRIKHFGKQRLVINHQTEDLSDGATYFISNRLTWQARGITRIRRHRWPVEVYHEEGKAEGLDQYQVRTFDAVYRHIALVAVTYSLLRAAQHDRVLLDKLQRQVEIPLDGTAGGWRRATQAQTLWALVSFVATALSQGQTVDQVMKPLLGAFSQ